MSVDILKSIYELNVSQNVRKSLWIFPFLECVHLYSVVFLVSVIASFDIHLMGCTRRRTLPSLQNSPYY